MRAWRKKRLKGGRMGKAIGRALFGRSKGVRDNLCITVDFDGTDTYGYSLAVPMGSADPDHTSDGQKLYEHIFKTDGSFIFKFGDAGDEQVPGALSLLMYSPKYNKARSCLWDDTAKGYVFTDQQLADDLIASFNAGDTKMCFNLSIAKGLVINYDYSTILMGENDG